MPIFRQKIKPDKPENPKCSNPNPIAASGCEPDEPEPETVAQSSTRTR